MLGSAVTLISYTSEPLWVSTEKRIHVLLQCSRPLFASLHLLPLKKMYLNMEFTLETECELWVFLWQSSHEKDTGSPVPLTILRLSGIALVLWSKHGGL